MTASTEVVVVGGGLAGILTAAELDRRGVEVVVLESSPHLGGVARTSFVNGYTLEPAVGTLLAPHPALTPIVDHLGVDLQPTVGPGTRFLATERGLSELRPGPGLLTTPGVGSTAAGALLHDLRGGPPSGEEETLHAFLVRRFGARAGALAAWLAASGVFAGDPHALSAQAAFPALTAMERASGSIVRGALDRRKQRDEGVPRPTAHVPLPGFGAFGDRASALLGDRMICHASVESIERTGAGWRLVADEPLTARHVVLACGSAQAARILGRSDPSPTAAPVAVVWLGGPVEGMPMPAGFGILTVPELDAASLGILLESSFAPHRAPDGHVLVRVIAGGATRPGFADLDDAAIVDRVGNEVARIVGSDVEASFVRVARPTGIPQYTVGHAARLEDFEGGLDDSVHVTGWSHRGVGVVHLATDAARIGTAIAPAT